MEVESQGKLQGMMACTTHCTFAFQNHACDLERWQRGKESGGSACMLGWDYDMNFFKSCLQVTPPDAFEDYVDVLVLGAGWTYDFLEPELQKHPLSYAATTTTGRNGTIKFQFDPASSDPSPFRALPDAKTVVIVFPIYQPGGSTNLISHFKETHPGTQAGFIQLGSTGIWDVSQAGHEQNCAKDRQGAPTLQDDKKQDPVWRTRHSPYNKSNPRAAAEDELLSLGTPGNPVVILNLCGLWGGSRSVRHFIPRIALTKEDLEKRTSLSMLHGTDYSRLILAIHRQWAKAAGQRFLVTDLRVYDVWELAGRYGFDSDEGVGESKTGDVLKWVSELMDEQGVRALPRTPEQLGGAYDAREVWRIFGLAPIWSVSFYLKHGSLIAREALGGPGAIRGGIPLVFPCFGPPPKDAAFSKLKQHGFARITPWTYDGEASLSAGEQGIVFSLTPTPETKVVFEPEWALRYTVAVEASGALRTELQVTNPSSSTTPLKFQTLQHTYLRLPEGVEPSAVQVVGLDKLSFADKVAQTQSQQSGPVTFAGEVDRVYTQAPSPVTLESAGKAFVQVYKDNYEDFVVWNPHKAKSDALADMEADGWKRFVCVEPGHAKEFVTIQPGSSSTSTQRLVPL